MLKLILLLLSFIYNADRGFYSSIYIIVKSIKEINFELFQEYVCVCVCVEVYIWKAFLENY